MFPVRFGLATAFEPTIGADAIWWSFPAGSFASMLLTIAYYRFGGWRKLKLVGRPAPVREDAMADAQPTAKAMPAG